MNKFRDLWLVNHGPVNAFDENTIWKYFINCHTRKTGALQQLVGENEPISFFANASGIAFRNATRTSLEQCLGDAQIGIFFVCLIGKGQARTYRVNISEGSWWQILGERAVYSLVLKLSFPLRIGVPATCF